MILPLGETPWLNYMAVISYVHISSELHRDFFETLYENKKEALSVADGQKGRLRNYGQIRKVLIEDCLYLPELANNLISVRIHARRGMVIPYGGNALLNKMES